MELLWLGPCRYEEADAKQNEAATRLVGGTGGEAAIGFESDPVVTLGRRATATDAGRSAGLPGMRVLGVDRGGRATYHGPGQLTLFLVMALQRRRLGVRAAACLILKAVQGALEEVGVVGASLDDEKPGIWVGAAKVAAIGLRLRDGVTTHGVAVNVCNDLAVYDAMIPCGIPGGRATSVLQLTGRAPGLEEMARRVVTRLLGQLTERLPPSPCAMEWRRGPSA